MGNEFDALFEGQSRGDVEKKACDLQFLSVGEAVCSFRIHRFSLVSGDDCASGGEAAIRQSESYLW